jgi:hypothetical protein
MTFQKASFIEKKATISIKGLPAIAPDGRDVYVWVEALNMPSVIPPEGPPAQLRTTVPGHILNDNTMPINARETRYSPPQPGKSMPVPGPAELQRMLLDGEVTQAQIEAVVPTYIVHVYHDTGARLRFGGTDRPMLTEQGAFGYYINHTGPLTGWQHELVGDGFTLEQLATDFYRIKKLANDGSVTVTTRITARENNSGGIWPWWSWIVLLIILLLLALLIFRRLIHV